MPNFTDEPTKLSLSDRLEVGVVADKVVLLALLQLAPGAGLVGDDSPDAEGVDVAVLAPPPPVETRLALPVEGLPRLEPNSTIQFVKFKSSSC